MATKRETAEVQILLNSQKANASIKELEGGIRVLKNQIRSLPTDSKEFIAKSNELKNVSKRYDEVNTSVKGVNGSMEALRGLLPSLGIAGAVTAMVSLGRAVLNTYGEFEKYRSVLTNTFGSQEKANAALEMLQDTAAKLPVSLQEVTEGYIKMVNRGMVPTQDEIIKLSDLAASQGKSLDMFIEAMLDAQTGEFERLKEFGVRAKSEGDKVTFTFRGQTETVAKTDEAIQKYLLSLGQMPGIAGSSAAVMNTLQGKISNLGDSWDRMLVSMGEGGFGRLTKQVISGIGGIVDAIGNWAKASPVENIRKEQVELNSLVSQLMQANISEEDRSEIITQLQTKYPDFLKNIDIEKATTEDLKKALAEANKQYAGKIALLIAQEKIQKQQAEVDKLQEKADKERYKAFDLATRASMALGIADETRGKTLNEQIAIMQKHVDTMDKTTESAQIAQGAIAQLSYYTDKYGQFTAKASKEEEALIEIRKQQKAVLDAINPGLSDQLDSGSTAPPTATPAAASTGPSDADKKAREKQLEDTRNYINELVLLSKSLIDQENIAYTERLKKAGLYNKDRSKLSEKEKIALQQLEKEHAAKIKEITDSEGKKQLDLQMKIIEDAFKQKEIALKQNNLAELELIGDNDEEIADQQEQFNEDMEALELARLIAIKQLLEINGEDTTEIEQKLLDKRYDQYKAGLDKIKDLEKPQAQEEGKEQVSIDALDNGPFKEVRDMWYEMRDEELAALDAMHEAGLMSEEEYQKARAEIQNRYNDSFLVKSTYIADASFAVVDEMKKLETLAVDEELQKQLSSIQSARDAEIALAGNNKDKIAAINDSYNKKETAAKEKAEKDKKAINKKYADAEFAVKIAQIIASTAMAVMQSYAQLGPIAGTIASVLMVAAGALQISSATKQRNMVKAMAKGKYNVIGDADGRAYDNVPYMGPVNTTGIIDRPTLISEQGGEMVITAPHVRNMQLNYPAVMEAIYATRVPQRAEGNYPAQSTSTTAPTQTAAVNAELARVAATNERLNNTLVRLESKGLIAYISYQELDNQMTRMEAIKTRTAR